jgi:hypothetical protein
MLNSDHKYHKSYIVVKCPKVYIESTSKGNLSKRVHILIESLGIINIGM